MVVGVPGAVVAVAIAVGEPPAVAVVAAVGEPVGVVVVAVGEPPGVVVAVGVVVVVVVAVAVGTAPSSRNNMAGLLHQLNFASGKSGESVAVGVGCVDPPKGFEHETSSTPASNALHAR